MLDKGPKMKMDGSQFMNTEFCTDLGTPTRHSKEYPPCDYGN